MRGKRVEGKLIMTCPRCGYKDKKEEVVRVGEKVEEVKQLEVIEQDLSNLPIVKEICPKCNNDSAYFWSMQTRASDEPETRFYRCVNCNFTWREYE